MDSGLFQMNHKAGITLYPVEIRSLEQDIRVIKYAIAKRFIDHIDIYDLQWEAYVLLAAGTEIDIVTGCAI